LNQKKMRKLCTDEVGGVKMKKNEKHFVIWQKIFSLLLVFGCSLALHFKDNSESLGRHFYNILNYSKLRRIEKD
jgi:hypothetical protein